MSGDLRAGRANTASGGLGRAEGRGHGGGHSGASTAAAGAGGNGDGAASGADGADGADGESNSGGLHFALVRNRSHVANGVALHFNHVYWSS